MKIISYSPATYHRSNQFKDLNDLSGYEYLLNNNFSKYSFLLDRTKAISHFLDIDYEYSPMPSAKDSYNLTFDEVTKNRCIELLSLGKRINVAWSGGIDSTYVLLSLHHYANDPDQINVYATYNSIIESGDLFDRFIKNNFKYTIRPNTLANNTFIENDCIYVTGAMSNQLFTPGLSFNKNRDSILEFKDIELKDPTQDKHNNALAFMADKYYGDVLTDECLEFLTPSILNSPKKINTIQELRWYVIFNYTWYSVLTNSLIGLEAQSIQNTHAFFNTEDFQLWSIHNKDPVTKLGDYSDERWQIREAITEYIGDSYYSKNKKKFTSLLSTTPHNWLYLMNDYTNVYINEGEV